MTDPKHKAFTALDPFFRVVQQGLAGLVDGSHYFDTIADNAVFEYRYIFPGYPQKIVGREALMSLYAGYGNNIVLHDADALDRKIVYWRDYMDSLAAMTALAHK